MLPMRIHWIIHDHRTSESITILQRQMRMVPIRARLIGDIKIVQEPIITRDGALAHERGAVGVARVALVDAVPVLFVF